MLRLTQRLTPVNSAYRTCQYRKATNYLKLAKRFSVSVQSSTVQLEKFVVEGLNSENTDNSSILHALKQILAQENNLFALKTMGDLYTSESKNRKKLGLECDENIAFKFFLQAAEKGDANAQLKVATYYFNAYDILLKSYKDGNVNNYIDDDVFFDRNSIVMDPETGTYKYIDPKSQRRKKMVEEREKLNPPKTAYDTTGLSSKVIKVNLKENVTLGMEWLLRSANNGNSQAQLMLSKRLLKGEGAPYNLKLATEMMKRAADGGQSDALFDLASVYYTGMSGPLIDESETLLPTEEQATGQCGKTFTIEKNIPLCVDLMTKAAHLDNPSALFWLGHTYLQGLNDGGMDILDKDPEKGRSMLQKAVELQHPAATYYMSLLSLHGYTGLVEKSIAQAQQLFLASVDLEHPEALYALADMYYHGTNEFELSNMKKDVDRAFHIYKKAAKMGHADALYCLGTMYYNGEGTDVDKKKAYDLYTMASSAGNWRAIGAMATMAMDGVGIPKDEKYAKHLASVYSMFEERERQTKN